MNNEQKNQIAAEAGWDIYGQFKEYGHGRNLPEHWTAIIKSAIEKALSRQGDDYATMDDARNRILDLESELTQLRTARASEQGADTKRLELMRELATEADTDGLTVGTGCYWSLNIGKKRISEGDTLEEAIDAAMSHAEQ